MQSRQKTSCIKHIREFGFTIVATPRRHSVDYVIYEHEGYTSAGDPLFHERGALMAPKPVETIEESEPYLHGSVKWDGCSNWHIDEQDRNMIHGCSKEDLTRIGCILGVCWEWTKDLCEHGDP